MGFFPILTSHSDLIQHGNSLDTKVQIQFIQARMQCSDYSFCRVAYTYNIQMAIKLYKYLEKQIGVQFDTDLMLSIELTPQSIGVGQVSFISFISFNIIPISHPFSIEAKIYIIYYYQCSMIEFVKRRHLKQGSENVCGFIDKYDIFY